jgi:hypothetical protein
MRFDNSIGSSKVFNNKFLDPTGRFFDNFFKITLANRKKVIDFGVELVK